MINSLRIYTLLILFGLLFFKAKASLSLENGRIEIVPTGCVYVDPYTWGQQYGFDREGKKIANNYFMENAERIAKKNPKEILNEILNQYYGALIATVDEEAWKKMSKSCMKEDGTVTCLRPRKDYFYPSKDKDICKTIEINKPMTIIAETPRCEEDSSGVPCLFQDKTMKVIKDLPRVKTE